MGSCNKLFYIIAFFSIACTILSACSKHEGQTDIMSLYSEVDKEIENRGKYTENKQRQLDSLRNLLRGTTDSKVRFDLSKRLAEEYEAFNSDSAFNYISLAQKLARETGDERETVRLEIMKSDIASHAGLFQEAHTMLEGIDRAQLDSLLLADYYAAYCSLYQYEMEYLPQGEYSERSAKLRRIYTDSLISVSPHESFDYIVNRASQQIEQGNLTDTRKLLEDNLKKYQSGQREYSILASILAYLHKVDGNKGLYHEYLAKTVISDIRGAVKENMAIRELATEVFEDGDIDRANRYLKVSFDDANFYSARMRNAQSSRMLPIIDKAYEARQRSQHNTLIVLLVIISCLFILVILGSIKIYKQMKRISEANLKIGKNNAELSEMSEQLKKMNGDLENANKALESSNEALAHMNNELKNSNQVSQEYAGLFMSYCSLNINDLEKYHLALRKLAVQGNMKGILKKLDATDVVADTLKTFYTKFDEAILNIYPQFVSKINSLLKEDSRLTIKSGEKLNTELRILALMKIGIQDNEKIAEFLRCSLATVYTYRSKLKKRALHPDDFEHEIMTD